MKDGSIVAWIESSDLPYENGFRLLGAHTDTPNLRLKPIQQRASNTVEQLSIETYGSPLLNSWLDRDLGISGRVIVKKNSFEEILFSSERPICRVPQLAIHLDRDINEKGLKLNPQTQLSYLSNFTHNNLKDYFFLFLFLALLFFEPIFLLPLCFLG